MKSFQNSDFQHAKFEKLFDLNSLFKGGFNIDSDLRLLILECIWIDQPPNASRRCDMNKDLQYTYSEMNLLVSLFEL